MRIGHNLLFMIPGVVGGTQTYATSLIRALAAIDESNEYVVYVNREAADLEITDARTFASFDVTCGRPADRGATRTSKACCR